ncbi:MAG TPA: ACP phosphodiesterase, partial [Nitrospiraceae bacterium]|nr:ACP phosphodiesterase [Nitrospiraceae bacterium]
DVPAMQQPEAYIGGAANLFDDDGRISHAGTREFLHKFMESFSVWIRTITAS